MKTHDRRRESSRAIAAICSIVLSLCGYHLAAHAEKNDKSKPTQIESDHMTYDDLQQLNIFTGNVVLTKGTITLKADRLELRQDARGYQYSIATGKPASFRQKREGLDEFIETYGEKLTYDTEQEVLRIEKSAYLRRLERERPMDEVRAAVIVYDAKTEFYQVTGGNDARSDNNPNGRVRVMLQPKSAPSPTSNPPSLQNDANLRSPR